MSSICRNSFFKGSLLVLLWVALAATVSAQEGRFFRGAERARMIEETQRLAKIQNRHEKEIMALPGVLGIGVGLNQQKRDLAFLVVVDKKAEMPKLPADIEGVPVIVERHEQDVPLHGAPACAQPCHANQLALPVEMGNSGFTVNRCSACTLGFKACDPGHQGDGVRHQRPLQHRLQRLRRRGAGRHQHLPCSASRRRASMFGRQHRWPDPAAGGSQLCRRSEQHTSIAPASPAPMPRLGPAFATSVYRAPSRARSWSADTVQKSGRTTGYTQGTVASTNFTVSVGPYNCCGTATFVNQIRVNAIGNGPFIMGGDSGSALLNMSDEVVGLLFSGPANGAAGNANQIAGVLNALGVTLDPVQCIECAAERAAEETSDPKGALEILYGVRDDVLKKSQQGRGYIDLFYEFSGDVVGLMARHPKLLSRTAGLLTKNLETLSTLVSKGEATMTEASIEEVSQLLPRLRRSRQG